MFDFLFRNKKQTDAPQVLEEPQPFNEDEWKRAYDEKINLIIEQQDDSGGSLTPDAMKDLLKRLFPEYTTLESFAERLLIGFYIGLAVCLVRENRELKEKTIRDEMRRAEAEEEFDAMRRKVLGIPQGEDVDKFINALLEDMKLGRRFFTPKKETREESTPEKSDAELLGDMGIEGLEED